MRNLQVSDDFLKDVKEALGYPVLDEEISEVYSDENIKELVIGDALETFFNYFPLVKTLTLHMSGSGKVEIDAPENMLGIVHYTLVDGTTADDINLNSGNPFYTAKQVVISQSMMSNYGSPFNYHGSTYSRYQQQFLNKSMKQLGKVFAVYFDEASNKIIAQSSQAGVMSIQIGLYSENLDDIPKRLRPHLMNYCQGTLKIKFAQILELMNSDLPLSFDKEAIKESGQEMMEAEEEWFKLNSTIQIMR